MKMVSASVAVVGVLALVLAIVEKLLSFQVDGVAASGWLRFAEVLFLLALVVMCYGKCCCCCKEESKPQP
jgi:Na+/H+ antiporter NhaB